MVSRSREGDKSGLLSRRQFVRALVLSSGLAATGLLAACAAPAPAPTQAPAAPAPTTAPAAPAATQPPKPTTAAAPTAAAPTTAPAAKKKGGTLTVGMSNDFGNFDPNWLGLVNYPMIANIYDSLIRYDKKMKPLPGLAEKWDLAADGTRVTLSLKPGVKFHSGRDLVAEDVVKNFDKARNKDTGFNLYQQTASVSEVQAKDKSTVVIQFAKPAPDVFDTLQTMYMIEPEAIPTLKNKGSGTGPFKFLDWVPGDHTTVQRNPSYWEKEKPSLDKVVFKVYQDTDAMAAALQSGLIDVATWVPYKDAAKLKEKFNQIEGQKGSLTWEVRINGTKPPFDKKEVRQAVQYAINRKGIVDKVLFGVGTPTALPFPDYSPAYDPKWDQMIKFDLDKAKELLAKGGYANGFEAEMIVISTDPTQIAVAQVIQDDMSKIGGKFKITLLDTAPYYQKLLAGEFLFTVSGSGRQHKYPTGIATNSIYRAANNPVWGNNVPKAYADAVNDANATVDPAKQKDAFKRMADAIMDESWVVTIAWRPSLFFTAKHVKDMDYNPDDMLFFHDTAVEK